jgi:hypothetical protein
MKRLLLLPAALVAALLPLTGPAAADTETPVPAPVQEPAYRFVAAPDIFNQDIADLTGQLGWNWWEPNSWTPELELAVDTVLDEIAAQQPGSLLVTGDLVQGHWGRDDMKTGIFGFTDTPADRRQSLRRAGSLYHSTNAERFAERGLTLHAAVGDHDLGDNPWAGATARLRFKRNFQDVFRDVFADAYNTRPNGSSRYANRPTGTPWRRTAYAVRLHPDVLLVTLDEFHKTKRGVAVEVVGGQLAWLQRTLAAAKRQRIPWVVVQGHVPVLKPVRTRGSSALSLRHGRRSPVWRTMVKGGVDLYLAGEVHATTLRTADGITQITTGAPIFQGRAAYLTAEVYGDRMDLAVHEFKAQYGAFPKEIWQGSGMKTEGDLAYPDPSTVVGTATLPRGGVVTRGTGNLVPYWG